MELNKKIKEKFVKDLRDLVSIKSLTADQEANKKVIDFVEAKLDKGIYRQRYINNGTTIFIASNKETLNPDICFLVHTDVVSGKEEQFTMQIRDGIAYGRGVSDMKFSIPIGYELLNFVAASLPKTSFAFVLTTDEETGGFNGAKYLVENIGYKPKVLIVPDGGDGLNFVDKAKGVCILKISSKGKPAHSSRIWEGKNAIEPLVSLCSKVLEKYGKNNDKESFETTVNIGVINGGTVSNQVCAEAYVILDFRFPETESFDGIYKDVLSIAKSIDSSLEISISSKGDPTSVNPKDPIVKNFLKCFEKVYARKILIKPTYGASDARYFSRLDIPILMIKPVGGDIHGDTENIDIDSCLKFYKAIELFIKHWR